MQPNNTRGRVFAKNARNIFRGKKLTNNLWRKESLQKAEKALCHLSEVKKRKKQLYVYSQLGELKKC
jgi:hypothetical protein